MEVKPATDNSCEGWCVADQLEELRGKHHLKKKDSEAYRESTQDAIREKERIIGKLRLENWNKRVQLAQHENGDEMVIKTVFKEDQDRLERLSLQRFTANEAIEEMDQKVCEGAKVLNMMRYGREFREQKLEELQQELARMHFLHKNSPEQNEAEQSVTLLENALDKALIKYDTARSISRRYHEILDRLKEESLTLPAKLDAMEQALLQQQEELKELQSMSKDAQAAREQTKKALSAVEQQAYDSRKQREAELSITRKEVERRKAEAEKVERRHARATLIVDNQDMKAQQELQQKHQTQQNLLTYEDSFRRIREATHVTDMDEVVARVLSQQEKQDALKAQVADLESQRQRMRTELERLCQSFHDMKYSGEKEMSRGESLLESMQTMHEKERDRLARTNDRLERAGNTLITVRSGVSSVLNKLVDVTLRPPEHNYVSGDVEEEMPLLCKKINELLKMNITLAESNIKNKIDINQFQEFLETLLLPDNVRVRLEKVDSRLSTMSEFDYEGQEQEQAPGRLDIKKQGQKIIDSKVKPKRRKVKKK